MMTNDERLEEEENIIIRSLEGQTDTKLKKEALELLLLIAQIRAIYNGLNYIKDNKGKK